MPRPCQQSTQFGLPVLSNDDLSKIGHAVAYDIWACHAKSVAYDHDMDAIAVITPNGFAVGLPVYNDDCVVEHER